MQQSAAVCSYGDIGEVESNQPRPLEAFEFT
jgi:hypothetical protein